jgi:hypothetical protein
LIEESASLRARRGILGLAKAEVEGSSPSFRSWLRRSVVTSGVRCFLCLSGNKDFCEERGIKLEFGLSGEKKVEYTNMKLHFLKPFVVFASLCGARFLGSEGTAIMTTGRNLVLFAIFLFGSIFLFRLFLVRLNLKYGFRLVLVLYFSCIFLIYSFCYWVRCYLGLYLDHLFPFLLIFCVEGGLPLPAPSGPSSSSSWTEDSFEMRVLLEPFSETEMEGTSMNPTIPRVAGEEAGPSHQKSSITRNWSLESSIRTRITLLEKENTLFLLDRERGEYWADVQKALNEAPSQREYSRLLDFENRDLQIRELKHECYSIYRIVLSEHPSFAENAPDPDPKEAILDFFDATWDELDAHPEWDPEERDRIEILFLNKVSRDMRERGPDSIYIRVILGYDHNQ